MKSSKITAKDFGLSENENKIYDFGMKVTSNLNPELNMEIESFLNNNIDEIFKKVREYFIYGVYRDDDGFIM